MAASLEDLKATMEKMAQQFAGFEDMVSTSLDKLAAIEGWQSTAEVKMGSLFKRSEEATLRLEDVAARLKQLELHPLLPAPPSVLGPPPLPQPPPPLTSKGGIDLNVTAAASTSASPLRADLPMGPGAGGSLLGPLPPNFGSGTQPLVGIPASHDDPHIHHPPVPKMEFPQFDGNLGS